MEVSSYVFKSPYPSKVQIGTENPNAKSDDSSSKNEITVTDKTQQKAQSFVATQENEVKPTLNESTKLDLYV
jgi:hypothetical protein